MHTKDNTKKDLSRLDLRSTDEPDGTKARDQGLQRYLAKIMTRSEVAESLFIERKFIDDEKWRRYAGSEAFRYSNLLREKEPDLDALLLRRRLVIVGEPGSGKSTVAQEAARRLASAAAVLPIFLNLRSYRGISSSSSTARFHPLFSKASGFEGITSVTD